MSILPQRSALSTDIHRTHSQPQAVLVGLTLIYLTIPNLLFLWGWFTPWAALCTSAVLLLVVGFSVYRLLAGATRLSPPTPRRMLSVFLVSFAVFLVATLFLAQSGLIGIWDSWGDFYLFRYALFRNLSEAAWPLVLPNGKEMSYYLANLLPAAALARILPHGGGEWALLLWNALAILLTLLLLSSFKRHEDESWAHRLLMVTLAVFVVNDPFILALHRALPTSPLSSELMQHVGLNVEWLCSTTLMNPPMECLGAMNSNPPTLLVASVILVCKRHHPFVLPVSIALLAALSPLGAIGLLPLSALPYLSAMRHESWVCIARSLLFPCAMAFLLAVYFCRADGEVCYTHIFAAWETERSLLFFLRLSLGWLLLVYPVWRVEKSAFFRLCACLILVVPFIFVGTRPNELFSGLNELWLKSCPAYMLILAWYWWRHWKKVGCFKYILLAVCILSSGARVANRAFKADTTTYLQFRDAWNGHLNHDAPFLNQSVPPCRQPPVPGILLQKAGESEKHFPGCMLPKAPGCDYSRPPRASDIRA